MRLEPQQVAADREAAKFATPPRLVGHAGAPRRVGVEIEFAAVSARDAAAVVQQAYGGRIAMEDPHRFHVLATELGDFVSELDSHYFHRAAGPGKLTGKGSPQPGPFQDKLRELLGDIGAVIVPCEIVCPPIGIGELHRLSVLLAALAAAGARGTDYSLFYAMGFQINPEIASRETAYIRSMLKAYLLLSDWLRAVIQPDLTRQMVAFAEPFPAHYCLKVVDPLYQPETDELIGDYLAYNPTRNRELDMLPLFAWLDEPRIRAAVHDPQVKSRPTFHYRLPDARFGDPQWSLAREWNRWCVVERLAEEPDRLAAMGRAYIANRQKIRPQNWAVLATDWLLA